MTYELRNGVYKYAIPKITNGEKQENRLRLEFIKHFKNYAFDFTQFAKTKANIYLYGHSVPFVDEKTELVFMGYFAGYLKEKK